MDRVDYQTHVIQDFLNLARLDELNLTPWYQRRSVWNRPQKAYLINTILEKQPVPSLYIRHFLDLENEKSIKEVVDGQQRLRSIIEYSEGQYAARHPNHDRPVKYEQLTSSEKRIFLMTSLSVGYLIGASDSDVIEMFGRLNSVSKTLNPQEKRNAAYSGEFKQFCLKESSGRLQLWRDFNLFSANDIARMTEVQFTSELVVNLLYGLQDYSAKQIDDTYKKYDEEFVDRQSIQHLLNETFNKIVSLPLGSIRDTIFSRSPIFFSLFLILSKARIGLSQIEDALFTVDEVFESDIPISERPKGDADFYVACSSNPHRIKSRSLRDTYLKSYLGV